MEELLKEYEETINSLFKSDDWLKEKGFTDWEEVKGKGIEVKGKIANGTEFYKKRMTLIKKAEQLQRDLHAHRKATV